jgi:hypothetical protein
MPARAAGCCPARQAQCQSSEEECLSPVCWARIGPQLAIGHWEPLSWETVGHRDRRPGDMYGRLSATRPSSPTWQHSLKNGMQGCGQRTQRKLSPQSFGQGFGGYGPYSVVGGRDNQAVASNPATMVPAAKQRDRLVHLSRFKATCHRKEHEPINASVFSTLNMLLCHSTFV